MKKIILFAVAACFYAATASYAQTQSASGAPGKTESQEVKKANASGQGATTSKTTSQATSANQDAAKKQPSGATPGASTGSGATGSTDARPKQAQKSAAGDGSTRPGGDSHKNANDVGRYSSDGSDSEKSMLNSKKAVAARKKNMTEADTTVKKGSGSAEKNTKNRTGKTGNYGNKDAQQGQKSKSDS